MLRLVICDDDTDYAVFLKEKILHFLNKDYEIIIVSSAAELLDVFEKSSRYWDILIMDVVLKDGDGIEAVRKIRSLNNHLKVIYITGYNGSVHRVFDTEPTGMLEKPFSSEELKDALNRAEAQLADDADRIIAFSCGQKLFRLYRDNIIYIESSQRKLVIHTELENLSVYGRLDEIEAALGSAFCRCHKSYIVNMRYIVEITPPQIILRSGEQIPLSRPNCKYVKERFNMYLGRRVEL